MNPVLSSAMQPLDFASMIAKNPQLLQRLMGMVQQQQSPTVAGPTAGVKAPNFNQPAAPIVPDAVNPGPPKEFNSRLQNHDNLDFTKGVLNQSIMHGSHGQHTMLGIDGKPVDANAPTGIDWLKANRNPDVPRPDTMVPNPKAEQDALNQIFSSNRPSSIGQVIKSDRGNVALDNTGKPVGFAVDKNNPSQLNPASIFDPATAPTKDSEAHIGPFLSSEQEVMPSQMREAMTQALATPEATMQQPTTGQWQPQQVQPQQPVPQANPTMAHTPFGPVSDSTMGLPDFSGMSTTQMPTPYVTPPFYGPPDPTGTAQPQNQPQAQKQTQPIMQQAGPQPQQQQISDPLGPAADYYNDLYNRTKNVNPSGSVFGPMVRQFGSDILNSIFKLR